MDWIVLEGVRPWDGRYPFDIGDNELTTREWGWIKRHAGYLPATIGDGFRGADPELFAVLACVVLRRVGRIQAYEVPDLFERFADAPYTSTIRLEGDDVVEASSPVDPPLANGTANSTDSGDASATNSANSTDHPNGSGDPDSVTSPFAPATSEN
jgi:hypothetical protein